MTEDLLRDLVEYKTYKDKAVMMASKSLIQLFRTTCPELLHKRDRGRPTEATIDLKRKEFGETDAAEFVPGAEVIEEEEDEEGDESDAEDDSEEESDEEDWSSEEEEYDAGKFYLVNSHWPSKKLMFLMLKFQRFPGATIN